MKDGPELVLNTDYENSPIPVPEGVGNKSRADRQTGPLSATDRACVSEILSLLWH